MVVSAQSEGTGSQLVIVGHLVMLHVVHPGQLLSCLTTIPVCSTERQETGVCSHATVGQLSWHSSHPGQIFPLVKVNVPLMSLAHEGGAGLQLDTGGHRSPGRCLHSGHPGHVRPLSSLTVVCSVT